MAIYHSSRPFRARADTTRTRESAVVLVIPQGLVPIPPNKMRRVVATRLSGQDGLGNLVSRYLQTLAANVTQYSTSDVNRLSFVTLDLVSVMLASQLDAEQSLSPEAREHALIARVQSFIQERLNDPALTPECIAAAHHISVRSLHRLFQTSDTTVAAWIRARRLERCWRDLTDPRLRDISVRSIAARWGFRHSAHFSRAFKAAYGISPTECRHTGRS